MIDEYRTLSSKTVLNLILTGSLCTGDPIALVLDYTLNVSLRFGDLEVQELF